MADTHRCYFPYRQLLENRMENTQRLELQDTETHRTSRPSEDSKNWIEPNSSSVQRFNPKTCWVLLASITFHTWNSQVTCEEKYQVCYCLCFFTSASQETHWHLQKIHSPCCLSHRSPVHPGSQKHKPVPLCPSSQDPCSEQLHAEREIIRIRNPLTSQTRLLRV